LARIRILEALDTLESPFDRHANPTHVTASAVVVGRRGTILHLHRHLRRWLQPGGHLEAGEMPFEAALRESREETGLELSHPADGPRLVHVDVHPGAKGHTHLDLRFLVLAEDLEPAPPAGESQQVRWCSWDEAETIADEALVGAIRVARRQPEALPLAPDELG
jgi:8-oxo-dGTP pyrophosphatase MutT (NUDIX family)